MMSKAVYVGSFDPVTLGHIDIIKRGVYVFGQVIIGIGNNSNKKCLFSAEERLALINKSIESADADLSSECRSKISVEIFDGLAVDFARKHYANVIIRGIRNNPDFEAEFSFAHINMRMAPEVEHVYLMASEKDHFVSSSIVKELWCYGTNYKNMVPYPVFEALENKRKENK